MKYKLTTRDLVLLSLLLAMKIILARVLQFNLTDSLRISFGFLITAIVAFTYGPLYTALLGALADIIGIMLFPTGTPFFGFTITAFVSGLIYGAMLYRRKPSLIRIIFANLFVTIICNICLNSLWLSMLNGKAFWVLLTPRIVKNLIMVPIEAMMIFVCLKYLAPFLKNRYGQMPHTS